MSAAHWVLAASRAAMAAIPRGSVANLLACWNDTPSCNPVHEGEQRVAFDGLADGSGKGIAVETRNLLQ